MGSREPFAAVSPGPPQNPQLDQQMRASYTTADGAYRSVGSPPPYPQMPGGAPAAMNLNSGEQKRKRGRPRKYGPDGNMSAVNPGMPPQMQSFSPPAAAGSASPTAKKARGRPPGSVNKKRQLEAVGKMETSFSPKGSTGIGFVPHVIDVKPGEVLTLEFQDVSSKILAFSQNGPRIVCILSASGAISSVSFRQASSGGTATYQGRFDILSLSGSFMLSDIGGQKTRTGTISTTLSGPDGRVFGGCVAGLLIASSPVLVIVGSFRSNCQKEPKSPKYTRNPLAAPPKMTGGSSSPSRGTFSESSGEPASPLNLSNNHHPHAMSAMPWK